MRVDFRSQQLGSDEVQRYLRLARITRAAVGSVVVGAIGFIAAASMQPSAFDRGWLDASVNEMQLYALPVHDSAAAPSTGDAARAVGDELERLDGVIHHG